MKCVENTYTQLYQHKGILIDKWNTGDFNPGMKLSMTKGSNTHALTTVNIMIVACCFYTRGTYRAFTQGTCNYTVYRVSLTLLLHSLASH